MSKVAAEILEVLVDEGDAVTEGQVLAELDAEGFRLDKVAAEADIMRLQVLLANQRKTLQRDESLTVSKLVSEAILDDARAAVDQTLAQLANAQSRLDKAEYQLSHCQVLAPISGTVQQRSISRGDYVNPNSPNGSTLFQLVDTRHLRARLLFPENLIPQIAIGTQVELIKGETRLQASISQLRPMLEPGNRALQALVDFDNQASFRPGESVSAEVILRQNPAALVVPEAALVQRPSGTVVYRLHNNEAEEVLVKMGIQQQGLVEITEGLAEGDALALDGAAFLTQGAVVEIKDAAQ
jgi:RND family efflux transporter MFP subunit